MYDNVVNFVHTFFKIIIHIKSHEVCFLCVTFKKCTLQCMFKYVNDEGLRGD